MPTDRDVGEEGGRVDTLFLADCYAYDPKPSTLGENSRFLCPLHGGDNQKSLAVNRETGKFKCFNCHRWGTVVDAKQGNAAGGFGSRTAVGFGLSKPRIGFGPPSEPSPLKDAKPIEVSEQAISRLLLAKRKFENSPAHFYARSRGIPEHLMKPHFLGYWKGKWGGEVSEWLTFPLRCPVTGVVVSAYGRNLHANDQARKARILGKTGLFGAPLPGLMPEDVVIVEGVFEALAILSSPGLPPPRAIIGVAAQAAWFDSCRRVTLILDDDQAGQGATDRLVKEFQDRRQQRGTGPQVLRLPPQSLRDKYGVKDMGDLLKQGIPVKLKLPALP